MDDIELVAGRFGLSTEVSVVGAPTRGELGQVWRVESSTGTWAVKEVFRPEPEDEVVACAEFQEAAVAAGLPAPRVVRTAQGEVALTVGARQYRVYSWVDVHSADVGLDPTAVGALVAALHRLRRPEPGPARPWYTEPVGRAAWTELAARMARSGFPLADRLAAAVPELVALEDLLTPPRDLQRLHLDLWADNVRATSTGGLCVLDWENSGAGDPSQELAVVLFEFCSWSPRRAAALHRAYVAEGGPGRVTGPEDFSMAIAQLGHILEWQCRGWLEGSTPDSRSHAAEAVAELLGRPLTRQLIHGIVDAVT